ncbi:transcriptional regulatory protein moc3 [Podospora fimiseda]|uniref:Transcriptional regulatory protein moc3 n=1 Tax=Podospora fimiseda TaxID=252190 RepID=A0AAN7BMY3_9PEZI|nr:transcriptional regulatory protein moc3 [Podospora fimiseda]
MAEGPSRPTTSSSMSTNTSPSLSAASSSTSPTTQPPKKRTRASKPKVRTGCITWIRRVKCGEEKPACVRCTSTGRTCDGYDKGAVNRYSSPDPAQTAELAKVEFVKACQWSEALRSMRPIAADIDGTETEKRFFARFRTATVDGLAAHLCNFTAFWNKVAPSSSYQDDAVKHAVLALGATYMLFQYPNQPILDGHTREDLDLFTIEQQNKSIEKVKRLTRTSSLESIRVTLICCLAFISLETLRANHSMALTHLTNGLRIIETLPPSVFDCLADGSVFVWPPTHDSLDLRDIIQLFSRLEASACFFTSGIQPVISERAYTERKFDDGSAEVPFADVSHARRAMCSFRHDVMARTHEIAQCHCTSSFEMFWVDSIQQRQQSALASRSARLGMLVDDFFSTSRFGMPVADKQEIYSLYLDLLYFRCAQFQVSSQSPMYPTMPAMDPLLISYPPPLSPAQPDGMLLGNILTLSHHLSSSVIGQKLRGAFGDNDGSPSLMDTGLVGPLYMVAVHTADLSMRGMAARLLAENVNPVLVNGMNDRRLMMERIMNVVEMEQREMAMAGMGTRWYCDVPRALSGVGCLPRVMDALMGIVDQSPQGLIMGGVADDSQGSSK